MKENKLGQFEDLKDGEYQVFTQDTLKRANERAIKLKLNRSIERKPLKKIFAKNDEHTFYPILFSMIHNDKEIRAQVALNKEGDTVMIDVPLKFWKRDVLTLYKNEEGSWAAK
jgi:hypothetical protein